MDSAADIKTKIAQINNLILHCEEAGDASKFEFLLAEDFTISCASRDRKRPVGPKTKEKARALQAQSGVPLVERHIVDQPTASALERLLKELGLVESTRSFTAAGQVRWTDGTPERQQRLLVEATNDAAQWVLPKGHVEKGEQSREIAVRGVHEEIGVWARIVHGLGDAVWSVDGAISRHASCCRRPSSGGLVV
jgi:hypothetical protein